MGDARLEALVRAALDLTSEHDLDTLLDRLVRCASEVADARYAALGVYDGRGEIERFVHYGIDAETVRRIGRPPKGRGLLGEVIVADRAIRLEDVTSDPRFEGFPPHHPRMRTFLGVPLRLARKRFGNLYLAEKRNGQPFDADDEHLVATLATFAAAAIEGALLVAVERERAAALADLAAAEERARSQREMLGLVIDAQEAERARVARDLHDEVGQALTSVLLGWRLVTDSLRADNVEDALARADEVRDLVAGALETARQLAFELRPTVLDDVGLVPAVRRLVSDTARRHGIHVEFELRGVDDTTRVSPALETVVYRVVQEALTNVVRHARASHTVVELDASPKSLRAVVRDDGVGFTAVATRAGALGIAGMMERAALVGGSLDIESAPGSGTQIALEVPRA